MKINLLLNGDGIRSGYLNLDPLADPNDSMKTQGDICNLDEYVDDAEADEIIATDIIDFLPTNDLESVLSHWLSKLRHGGSIVVGGVDIREVARGLLNQRLTLNQANMLLYGGQQSPHDYRKTTLTLQKLLEIFQQLGFKVIQKRQENYFYQVKAERP